MLTWWDQWWIAFTSAVAAALLVIVVSAVPKFRKPVLSRIAQAGKFVWDSRPARNARNYAKDQEAQKAAIEKAREAGFAKRDAEVRAERAEVALKPRWAVKRHGPKLPQAHVLINYVPEAVQTHVQLTAPIDKFAIDGDGYWKDGIEHILNKHQCEGHFQGSMKAAAVKGVTFTITYRDENGDEQTDYAHLDPVPLYTRISSATTTRRIDRGPGRGGTSSYP